MASHECVDPRVVDDPLQGECGCCSFWFVHPGLK
jgi:hypothetical protein